MRIAEIDYPDGSKEKMKVYTFFERLKYAFEFRFFVKRWVLKNMFYYSVPSNMNIHVHEIWKKLKSKERKKEYRANIRN